MAIRFNIVLVVTHLLVSVEQTKGVLLGDFPVETDMKTRLLQTPGIEELDIGIGSHCEAFLVILHLQTASQNVLSHATIGLRLSVIGIIENQIATTKIEMSLPLIAERKIEFKIILSVEY